MAGNMTVSSPRPSGAWGLYRTHVVVAYGADKGQKREIGVDIWLPCARPMSKTPYDCHALDYWRQATFWTAAQKKLLSPALKSFYSYGSPGSQRADCRLSCPVIIFSHGFGAWSGFYSYLIDELVSQGFAVIGLNHTGNAGFTRLNGKVLQGRMTHQELFQTPFAEEEQQQWMRDLKAVLRWLQKEKTFQACCDVTQIFVMGQSFGGSLATHAAFKIDGLRGCVNLDGAVFGTLLTGHIKAPLLILRGGVSIQEMSDPQVIKNLMKGLGISKKQAEDFRHCYLDRIKQIAQENPQRVFLEDLPGINHVGFTDFNFLAASPLFDKAPVGDRPPFEIIQDIRGRVMTFLRGCLGGET